MTQQDPWPEIETHRRSIDNIDSAMIHLLAERFKHTSAVGVIKAAHGLTASTQSREDAQAVRLRALAAEAGLDPDFAETFIRFLIEAVIQNHLKENADMTRA